MNKEIKCVVITTVVSISGCAGMGYKNAVLHAPSEMTLDQAQQYQYECQNQSMMIDTPDYEYRGTFMAGANIQSKQRMVYDNCLRSKGFREPNMTNSRPTSVEGIPAGRTSDWRPVNP